MLYLLLYGLAFAAMLVPFVLYLLLLGAALLTFAVVCDVFMCLVAAVPPRQWLTVQLVGWLAPPSETVGRPARARPGHGVESRFATSLGGG